MEDYFITLAAGAVLSIAFGGASALLIMCIHLWVKRRRARLNPPRT
jgi:hypothetical protein